MPHGRNSWVSRLFSSTASSDDRMGAILQDTATVLWLDREKVRHTGRVISVQARVLRVQGTSPAAVPTLEQFQHLCELDRTFNRFVRSFPTCSDKTSKYNKNHQTHKIAIRNPMVYHGLKCCTAASIATRHSGSTICDDRPQ